VAGGLATIEGKGKKGGLRGRKSHIYLAQEKAQLEVQSGKQLSLEGVLRANQTPGSVS